MDRVSMKQMSVLVGTQIKEIGRTFVIKDDYFDPFMDTLYFKTHSNNLIQLLRANQDGLHIQISPSKQEPIIDLNYEIEPKEKLISKEIEIQNLRLPIEVKSITELWAGSEGKDFLVGFILHGNSREALLSVCTETDEIELMNYNDFRQRIETFPFYYGTLSTYWYQKN